MREHQVYSGVGEAEGGSAEYAGPENEGPWLAYHVYNVVHVLCISRCMITCDQRLTISLYI